MECKKGDIKRKAYIRISGDGKKVVVLAACIKDQEKPGKSPKPEPTKPAKYSNRTWSMYKK